MRRALEAWPAASLYMLIECILLYFIPLLCKKAVRLSCTYIKVGGLPARGSASEGQLRCHIEVIGRSVVHELL